MAGEITGENITVTVPYATNVDSLTATFTITGESVTVGGEPQVSGQSSNNFTNPVTYTVHAADGGTKDYVVTVIIAENTAKEITAFSLNGYVGSITGESIEVIVPYQINRASLIATFTITGESVTVDGKPQFSEQTANNFNNPVTYTVYAADGSTQNYVVTVLVQDWTNVGNVGFSAGIVNYTSIVFNPANNQPYVAYQDFGNSQKATVMTFNGTNWVNVGNPGFSVGAANYVAMAFNPSTNEPYVVYQDTNNGNKATMMKFNGVSWDVVGNAGFSAGLAGYISMVFNPADNQPYVAYLDGSNGNKATVMTFDGNSWVPVGGSSGFSAGPVQWTNITINPVNNHLYVVYRDGAELQKATAVTFDGTNWVNVGNAGFSSDSVNSTSIVFNPATNEPYVVYRDEGAGGYITVMKFDGANWKNVGKAGFSPGQGFFPNMAFNPSNNQPYVVYKDLISNKAMVMAFNGTNWMNVGRAGISGSVVEYTDIAFNPLTNQPYIVYRDSANANKATVMTLFPY